MAKYFYTILACLACLCPMNGQLVLKAGGLFSDFRSKDFPTIEAYHDRKLSYFVGVGYYAGINKRLGIEFGASYYNLKQSTLLSIHEGGQSTFEIEERLPYIMVPIQVKFNAGGRIEFGAGLEGGILMNKESAQMLVYDAEFDLAGIFTLTVYPLEGFGLELGYHYGFIPVLDIDFTNGAGEVIGEYLPRNRFYTLGISTRF